ncbi:YhdH/YhfP family quinone oxidoreductase [Companilactobacillus sp. HBUAS59699]|uniref:YhdH/YhfP family quinone oxidoreductase n=1 Tax=Companilactobacillus sp. HBUAS59699 TaxID=3109358 RepID=UPI002FEFC943
MDKFKAIVVDQNNDNVEYGLKNISINDLSDGEVLIEVCYSSLNYKDMLAVQNNGGVIKNYPMIPGIDLSGVVVESSSSHFVTGDKVLATGFQLGMSYTGGMAQYARVPAEWLVKLPAKLSLKQAMIIGTAGFTAALSVIKLLDNGMKVADDPEILVTGSTGGVGSIAVQILSVMGFKHINALVRKEYQVEVAKHLGATRVVMPDDIKGNGKLLSKQRFNYVIDTVGGDVTAELIPQIHYGGGITMCGNAGGIKLSTNVLPFILRGVDLYGIDSVNYPIEKRLAIWKRFADDWEVFDKLQYNEVTLAEIPGVIEQLKSGKHLGRTIIKISEKI